MSRNHETSPVKWKLLQIRSSTAQKWVSTTVRPYSTPFQTRAMNADLVTLET